MRWTVHGERRIYGSPWLDLCLSDVELPNGARYEHHLVRVPQSVGAAVLDGADQVLMVWRHRFTTDTWNWELPGGWVDPGETPAHAAAREVEEETGWRPRGLRELAYIQPIAGISDAEQFIYVTEEARHIGPPVDGFESDRVAWVPLADVPDMLSRREIVGGVSVVALLQILHGRDTGASGTTRAPRSAA